VTVLSVERFAVAVGAEAEFGSLLADLLATVRGQPGLLWADGAPADGAGFIVVSEWRTAADLDAWEGSDAAAAWDESVDPLLTADRGRRRFAPLALP